MDLALQWPTLYSASRIFVDGELLVANGKVGNRNDPAFYQPHLSERLRTFRPKHHEFDLIIQVANFDIFLAGIARGAPVLGTPTAIINKKERETAGTFLLVGSLLIMGIYHFCLFALRTKSRSALYFGTMCLTACAYI
jgi:hypothetical protein